MFQQQSFSHHGYAFTIEAEGWPNDEAAYAAIIELEMWALRLDPDETDRLHKALRRETEALVHDAAYDRDSPPLPAVRDAQRSAMQAGLHGEESSSRQPTVSIEAADI